MIERLSIDGYKSLKGIDFATGPLNVLVGPNASGKSSILQILLLLRQSADKEGNVDGLHMSGPLYEAGTAQDALHPDSEYRLSIGLQADGERMNFVFHHDRDDKDLSSKRVLRASTRQRVPSALYDRDTGFAYLNAERIGPRVTYALPPDEMHLGGMVGKYGEYTTAVLARAANGTFIDEWAPALQLSFANTLKLLDAKDLAAELSQSQGRLDLVCNSVLGWILPGTIFEAQEYEQSDAASLRFIRDPLATKSSVRATHIGFGLVYTLPIITAALALRRGGMLLVENPEAHLHPFSQSRIGVFLALVAASGRQVFLETHSDHVINGIRLAVKYGAIAAGNVFVNSVSRPESGSTSKIQQIRISEDGRLNEWPEGFFDQIESDLSKL
jgi:predicted ATPase